jgi:phosphoserine phosphatase RsbU/P
LVPHLWRGGVVKLNMSTHYAVPSSTAARRLLPQLCFPLIPGVDYYAEHEPAEQAGGDLFDFARLPDGRLAIAIGEVSGKGMPAAVMVAGLRRSLRGLALQRTGSAAQVVAEMNEMICDIAPNDFCVSLFYAQYDKRKRHLEYVNAGHEPPLLFRGERMDRVRRLELGGTVLGLTTRTAYRQGTIELDSTDLLVAYTDGVCETMNRQGDDWGEARLIRTVRCASNRNALEVVRRVQDSIERFSAGRAPTDDRTILAFRTLDSSENNFA